jgi:hypothetical protein
VATYFFLDEKVGKKSRKNDASPHKASAWPAVLSVHRSSAMVKGEILKNRLGQWI